MKNKKVELISSELKGMSIEDIKDKGSKYKELIEARDLEDILFKWIYIYNPTLELYYYNSHIRF